MHPHEYGLLKAAYSVKETLTVLSIGRTALYALVKTKRLKATKFGKKTLFLAADLAQLLDDMRNSTPVFGKAAKADDAAPRTAGARG
jgi:excisionase family DNA binding protein